MEEGGEGDDIKGNERAKASTLLAMATAHGIGRDSLRRAEQIVEGTDLSERKRIPVTLIPNQPLIIM